MDGILHFRVSYFLENTARLTFSGFLISHTHLFIAKYNNSLIMCSSIYISNLDMRREMINLIALVTLDATEAVVFRTDVSRNSRSFTVI